MCKRKTIGGSYLATKAPHLPRRRHLRHRRNQPLRRRRQRSRPATASPPPSGRLPPAAFAEMYMSYGWPQVVPLLPISSPDPSPQIVYLRAAAGRLLVVGPSHIEIWSSSQVGPPPLPRYSICGRFFRSGFDLVWSFGAAQGEVGQVH